MTRPRSLQGQYSLLDFIFLSYLLLTYCVSVYTASWTAPLNAGVHSNQYFHCTCHPAPNFQNIESVSDNLCIDMASNGEIRVNQAKRGYDVTGDEQGLIWVNP